MVIPTGTHSCPFIWIVATSFYFLFLRSSPWSNQYYPPLQDGAVPSKKLRELEVQANDAFDTYREMLVFIFIILLLYFCLIFEV